MSHSLSVHRYLNLVLHSPDPVSKSSHTDFWNSKCAQWLKNVAIEETIWATGWGRPQANVDRLSLACYSWAAYSIWPLGDSKEIYRELQSLITGISNPWALAHQQAYLELGCASGWLAHAHIGWHVLVQFNLRKLSCVLTSLPLVQPSSPLPHLPAGPPSWGPLPYYHLVYK